MDFADSLHTRAGAAVAVAVEAHNLCSWLVLVLLLLLPTRRLPLLA